jgi:alkane 1-monooxygenase
MSVDVSMTGSEATWVDSRRGLWVLSAVLPMLPLVSVALWLATAQTWTLWITLACVYGLFPLLDQLLGDDENNPPEAVVPRLETDPWYRWLLVLALPGVYATLLVGAWLAATADLTPMGYLGLALSIGWTSAAGINAAHELGHKKSKLEIVLAWLALAPSGYGHFRIEHTYGHHRDVATPEDPASSRLGESYYRFMTREIPGALRRAWALERARLARQGRSAWHPANENLQAWSLTVLLWAVLLIWLGPVVVPLLLIQAAFAYSLLSAANYVEHYGLVRRRDDSGRYERVRPEHSWNSNRVVSNLMLYQLERHSDHHAWPARRYQSLRHFPEAPQLPTGYFGMFLVALVPPLWRRLMDERTLEHAGWRLEDVNMAEGEADRVRRRFPGRLAGQTLPA